MKSRLLIILIISTFPVYAACQTEPVNRTDAQGRKQGHWINKYPHGAIRYEGEFTDDHPIGEFRRYYEDGVLMSVLVYSADGTEANATLYHPNGYVSAMGRYINQLKEGKWKFYSAITENYLINEAEYKTNILHGLSQKYFPDGTLAEKLVYINGKREGEWVQYYPDGRLFLRSYYKNDLINGKFEVWFGNGRLQFSGTYKDNRRDGTWFIYDEKGSVLYKINYVNGNTKDRQMEIDASDYIDNLEKNAGKIPDPEKTGEIR